MFFFSIVYGFGPLSCVTKFRFTFSWNSALDNVFLLPRQTQSSASEPMPAESFCCSNLAVSDSICRSSCSSWPLVAARPCKNAAIASSPATLSKTAILRMIPPPAKIYRNTEFLPGIEIDSLLGDLQRVHPCPYAHLQGRPSRTVDDA